MTKPPENRDELYQAIGRIEGKVDVAVEMMSANSTRLDSKVGWAPFGVLVAAFLTVTAFFGKLIFGNT